MEDTKKRPPKTSMERKFLKALPNARNGTEAAKMAGYKDPTQAAYENKIKLDFSEILDVAGLTDTNLAKGLANLTKATKKIRLMENKEKGLSRLVEVPDNSVRLRAIKLALELKGKFPTKEDLQALSEDSKLEDLIYRLTDDPPPITYAEALEVIEANKNLEK